MKRSIFHIACSLFILLSGGIVHAQQGTSGGRHGRHGVQQNAPGAPAIVVKATVDQQKIVVGQRISLALEATVPGNAPLAWPSPDSMAHFDWLEKGKIDTISRSGETYYRQHLTITSFDSGAWAIPAITFLSGGNAYATDSIRIEVGYSKFDPNQDFHDIKDIVDIPNPYARWIPWIIAAATVLSLALVIWLIRKRKVLQRLVAGVRAPKLTPYEDAVAKLNELEKAGFVFDDQVAAKLFYTRLSDIHRIYLFRQSGIRSLAETSEELIREMRSLPLDSAEYEQLGETLRLSDFVKFARYQPGSAENERSFRVIKAVIEKLHRNGQEDQQQVVSKPEVRGRDNMPVKNENKNS